MNDPWSTEDQVKFIMERWPEAARNVLLAALLEQAEWQGTVSVNGELWVHESKIRPLEKLLEDAGAVKVNLEEIQAEGWGDLIMARLLCAPSNDPDLPVEGWFLPVPKKGGG